MSLISRLYGASRPPQPECRHRSIVDGDPRLVVDAAECLSLGLQTRRARPKSFLRRPPRAWRRPSARVLTAPSRGVRCGRSERGRKMRREAARHACTPTARVTSSCSVCGRAARAARLTAEPCRTKSVTFRLLFQMEARWRRDGGETEARRRRAGGELEARCRRRRDGRRRRGGGEMADKTDGGERRRRNGGEKAAAAATRLATTRVARTAMCWRSRRPPSHLAGRSTRSRARWRQ